MGCPALLRTSQGDTAAARIWHSTGPCTVLATAPLPLHNSAAPPVPQRADRSRRWQCAGVVGTCQQQRNQSQAQTRLVAGSQTSQQHPRGKRFESPMAGLLRTKRMPSRSSSAAKWSAVGGLSMAECSVRSSLQIMQLPPRIDRFLHFVADLPHLSLLLPYAVLQHRIASARPAARATGSLKLGAALSAIKKRMERIGGWTSPIRRSFRNCSLASAQSAS